MVTGAALCWLLLLPSDKTPEGAYLRIAGEIGRGDYVTPFHYLEERAQHACYSIANYRSKSSALIATHYKEPERSTWLARYQTYAEATAGGADPGAAVWLAIAEKQGFLAELKKDLSGIAKVEHRSDDANAAEAMTHATITTMKGTRYAFRRRDNGMWGLTLFTAFLDAEAKRASRDYEQIKASVGSAQ